MIDTKKAREYKSLNVTNNNKHERNSPSTISM